MNIKIPFLLFLFLIILTSCNAHQIVLAVKDPPTDYFVQIFKELEVIRCPKNLPPPFKRDECDRKVIISTGSGLLIRLSQNKSIVLSAGHVCEADDSVEEDEKYKYKWKETLNLLDKNKLLHQGHVILSKQGYKDTADLCSIFSPTLEDQYTKKSNIYISKTRPKVGEEIYYIGAPRGIYHPPTALILKGIFNGNIDNFTASATIPAAPGSSGSVILSMNNKIYGVLFAVHNNFRAASVITSYEETKKFLKETLLLLR